MKLASAIAIATAITTFVANTDRASANDGASPGCDGADPMRFLRGKTTSLMLHDLEHLVSVPMTYDSNHPTPLVLEFHGWGGNSRACGDTCNIVFPDHGVIIVSLTGYGDDKYHAENGQFGNSWSGVGTAQSPGPDGETCTIHSTDNCYSDCNGSCVDNCWWTTCKDSVGLTIEVLDLVEQSLCINQSLVFATGCSNGGMFVFELASNARIAPRIAGIFPHVGLPHNGYNHPPYTPGTHLFGMWGRWDPIIPSISNTHTPEKSLDHLLPLFVGGLCGGVIGLMVPILLIFFHKRRATRKSFAALVRVYIAHFLSIVQVSPIATTTSHHKTNEHQTSTQVSPLLSSLPSSSSSSSKQVLYAQQQQRSAHPLVINDDEKFDIISNTTTTTTTQLPCQLRCVCAAAVILGILGVVAMCFLFAVFYYVANPPGWYYTTSMNVTNTWEHANNCTGRELASSWFLDQNVYTCYRATGCVDETEIVECLFLGWHQCYFEFQLLPFLAFILEKSDLPPMSSRVLSNPGFDAFVSLSALVGCAALAYVAIIVYSHVKRNNIAKSNGGRRSGCGCGCWKTERYQVVS